MGETLFSVRDAARLFGLKESRLRYWAQTGFVNPSAQQGAKRVYTFSDLVEIKAARDLLDAGIPLQRVRKNLQALRDALPDERRPLQRLRVRSDGDTLVVTEERATYSPVSGQLVLDFDIDEIGRQAAEVVEIVAPAAAKAGPGPASGPQGVARQRSRTPIGRITTREPAPSREPRDDDPDTAYGWFLRGCAADGEARRMDEAIEAYQRAIDLDPSLAAAHTNLGNLHHARGNRTAALRAYETACALDPEQAESRYNLANIYEEEGDLDLAIAEYRRALHCHPDFLDAHFNLALVLEKVGGRVQARSHWRRYVELAGDDDGEARWREIARDRLETLDQGHP